MASICEATQPSAKYGVDCHVRMERQGSRDCILHASNTPHSELRVAGRNRRPNLVKLEFTATCGAARLRFIDSGGNARINANGVPLSWPDKVEMSGNTNAWLPVKAQCEPTVGQVGNAAHIDVAVTEVECAFGQEVRSDWLSPLAIDVLIR